MTTYRGETLTPQLADEDETAIILKLEKLSEAMKDLGEKYQAEIEKLPRKVPLVVETEDGYRTIIVDTPKGHFVTYRDSELSMNTKTTKADLKALEL